MSRKLDWNPESLTWEVGIFFFKFIHVFERAQRAKDTDIFHQLVDSQDDCNGQGQARVESGASCRSPVGLAGLQALGPWTRVSSPLGRMLQLWGVYLLFPAPCDWLIPLGAGAALLCVSSHLAGLVPHQA